MTDESRKRARPNILVAGTPGTKKTSTCSLLASATALPHINVGELAKEKSFHDGWDVTYARFVFPFLCLPASPTRGFFILAGDSFKSVNPKAGCPAQSKNGHSKRVRRGKKFPSSVSCEQHAYVKVHHLCGD